MKVHPIEAFTDNYIWLVQEGNEAVVVDPGEGPQVMDFLETHDLILRAILLTHNHDDHVGGVLEIFERYPDIPIFGPDETEPLADHNVKDGDTFEILGKKVRVFLTAGHTEGHVSYLMDDMLFCGDALFSAGCGRVFTGDYEAQFEALNRFKQLDDRVRVFAGHEYTETNLRFALTVDPHNEQLKETLNETIELRARDLPTLPSTIGKEKDINLFLQAESLEEMTALRNKRDDF